MLKHMEQPPPNLNPHRDNEIKRGRDAAFEAGPQTVKAARIESYGLLDRSTEAMWQTSNPTSGNFWQPVMHDQTTYTFTLADTVSGVVTERQQNTISRSVMTPAGTGLTIDHGMTNVPWWWTPSLLHGNPVPGGKENVRFSHLNPRV